MNKDNHLIFEALQNSRGVRVSISDYIEDKQEGISFKKGDSVYFNDPDYPSYKNIVFQIRDLHGEDANLWSNELPSSGKPFWVKIKNLKKVH